MASPSLKWGFFARPSLKARITLFIHSERLPPACLRVDLRSLRLALRLALRAALRVFAMFSFYMLPKILILIGTERSRNRPKGWEQTGRPGLPGNARAQWSVPFLPTHVPRDSEDERV